MKKKLAHIAAFCLAGVLAFMPVDASAALYKKGSSGGQVKQIQTSLKKLGYFTYKNTTGYYGSITVKAVKKFQKAKGLVADGIVGNQTLKALEKSSKGEISLLSTSFTKEVEEVPASKKGDLSWFSEVQYIFQRGDVAEVIDVDTGKTFHLKRTYGTNHADVEQLKKADTNVIKSIWGGWSWTRRAVVVKVNGYILAGSLAAMPHAGKDSATAGRYVSGRSGGYGYGQNLDAVKNNGVNGVLDLHFKNSKTHGSNSVNAAHQAAVKKANSYIKNHY